MGALASTSFPAALTVLVLVPVAGALVLLAMPRTRPDLFKPVALVASTVSAVLAVWVLAEFEGLLWGLYGWVVFSGPIVVFGATEAGLSALVLLRLWMTRHRIRAALGHTA